MSGNPSNPLVGHLVRITDTQHPHYPEQGRLTGDVISLFGKQMLEVRLEACRHETEACFASQDQMMSLSEES